MEDLTDGSTVAVDAAYFKESIEYPNAKVVKGFAPVMLPYQFTDQEIEALIAYAVERLAAP
jgi:cytochrome c oxidase subunit 2